jgi:L-iditol 2-dehydrogenase
VKAAVYRGPGEIVVEDVPDPSPAEGEVLLRIDACSVCGTDLRTWRHGDPRITPPRILGHEFSATVEESRAPDAGLSPGDRVVMFIVIVHQSDRWVEAGRANLTAHRTTISYHHDGAFAPWMRVPAAAVAQGNLLKVTADIPHEHMSLAEPLGCCVNAHSRLRIGLGDSVAVLGAGPIGVMHACLARQQGARQVIVLDPNPARLQLAGRFDIDAAITVRPDGSHRDEVLALTDGFGPSVVIVAAGSPAAQNDALAMAAKAGRVCLFAGLPKSNPIAALDINQIHYKELEVSGSYSEKKRDFEAAVGLLVRGRFPAGGIVTHRLPLGRLPEAFPLMEEGEALKVCILPQS